MGDNALAQSQVKWAAQNGINIVSPTLWGIPWTKEGETPTLDGTDIAYWIESSIKANPQGLFMKRPPAMVFSQWSGERRGGGSRSPLRCRSRLVSSICVLGPEIAIQQRG